MAPIGLKIRPFYLIGSYYNLCSWEYNLSQRVARFQLKYRNTCFKDRFVYLGLNGAKAVQSFLHCPPNLLIPNRDGWKMGEGEKCSYTSQKHFVNSCLFHWTVHLKKKRRRKEKKRKTWIKSKCFILTFPKWEIWGFGLRWLFVLEFPSFNQKPIICTTVVLTVRTGFANHIMVLYFWPIHGLIVLTHKVFRTFY